MLDDSLNNRRMMRARRLPAMLVYPLWVTAGFAVGLGITYIVTVLYVAVAGRPTQPSTLAVINMVMMACLYGVVLATVVLLPKKILGARTTSQEMGVERLLTWKDIALSPIAFVIYIILTSIAVTAVTALIPGFDVNQKQAIGFSTSTDAFGKIMACIALVVAAPVAEELIFRGYLYGKMRYRGVGIAAAIVLTSVVFAIAHGQLNVGVDVFALSVVLCGLREVTGTIWAGVLVHMIKNGIAFYFLFINPSLLNTIGN